MWQNIIVVIIVLVAAYYVVRHLWASVRGGGTCEEDHCGDCPFAEGCHEPKQRPRKSKSKGSCGCH